MNSAEIESAISEGLRPSGSELRPALARSIEQRMAQDLRPVSPLRPASWYAAGFGLIFLAPVMAGLLMLRAGGVAKMGPLMLAAVFGALAVSATLLSISLAAEMSPGSRKPASPAALSGFLLAGLALGALVIFPYRVETHLWTGAGGCLWLGARYAVPAAGLAWVLLRRGALLSPILSSAAAGLLGGLAGMTVLEIHCPDHNVAHVLAGHWALALAGAGLGCLVALLSKSLGTEPLD